MLKSEDLGAICVQKFDDSRNSAIHTTYRALLRSSSMWEPRNPLYSVIYVNLLDVLDDQAFTQVKGCRILVAGVPTAGHGARAVCPFPRTRACLGNGA